MPLFDYVCSECGFVFNDVLISSSELNLALVKCDECGVLCDRLIGAPAHIHRVVRCGPNADPRTKAEEQHDIKKNLLQRSKDHDFKRGDGANQRRARIEQLHQQGVPVPGHHGF